MSKRRCVMFIKHCVLPQRRCVMGKTWRVLPVNRHEILFRGRRNIVPRPPECCSEAAGTLFRGRRNVVPRPPERLSQAVGQPWIVMPIQKLRKSWKRAGTKPCARPLVACNRRDASKSVKTTGRGATPVKNGSNMSPEGATERSAQPPLRGWD